MIFFYGTIGSQFATGVYCDSRTIAFDSRRFLANGMGEQQQGDRDANEMYRERQRKMRSLLANGHFASLLRRHLRHDTQRDALSGLEYHGIHVVQSKCFFYQTFLMI